MDSNSNRVHGVIIPNESIARPKITVFHGEKTIFDGICKIDDMPCSFIVKDHLSKVYLKTVDLKKEAGLLRRCLGFFDIKIVSQVGDTVLLAKPGWNYKFFSDGREVFTGEQIKRNEILWDDPKLGEVVVSQKDFSVRFNSNIMEWESLVAYVLCRISITFSSS